MEIVLASNNLGKLREMQAIFVGKNFTILPQSQFAVPTIFEQHETFVENAIIKARNATSHANLPAIADDSGLVVDALAGAPGVRSARYAGDAASDERNIADLLRAMRHIPQEKRSARFHCVIVFLRFAKDPMPIICQGTWEGNILFQPRGKNGFGYDSVFFVPEYNCSSAELSPEVKNRISHRGRAVNELIAHLLQ